MAISGIGNDLDFTMMEQDRPSLLAYRKQSTENFHKIIGIMKRGEDPQLMLPFIVDANKPSEKFVDKRDTRETMLTMAATCKNDEYLRTLLSRGFSTDVRNMQGRTALHHAVDQRSVTKTDMLMAHGANTNARDWNGHTPLFLAIHNRDSLIIERLMLNNANPRVVDRYGYTPLMIAVNCLNHLAMELLFSFFRHQKAYFINQEDLLGHTPMILVIIRTGIYLEQSEKQEDEGDKQTILKKLVYMLGLLMEHGADPHRADHYRKTPLMYTVEYNLPDATQLLVSRKVDRTQVDMCGLTALDYARHFHDQGQDRSRCIDILSLSRASTMEIVVSSA